MGRKQRASHERSDKQSSNLWYGKVGVAPLRMQEVYVSIYWRAAPNSCCAWNKRDVCVCVCVRGAWPSRATEASRRSSKGRWGKPSRRRR